MNILDLHKPNDNSSASIIKDQNKTKHSGTERCLNNIDQRLFVRLQKETKQNIFAYESVTYPISDCYDFSTHCVRGYYSAHIVWILSALPASSKPKAKSSESLLVGHNRQ